VQSATYSSGTYQVAIVSRGNGSTSGWYYFIKGGAYTNWTLIWISHAFAGGVTTLFPTIMTTILNDSVFTAGTIRVPNYVYKPAPLLYDTFTRANGALGNSETAGPESQSVTALAWSDLIGTTQISSNTIKTSATDGGIAAAGATLSSADVMASMALTRGTGTAGMLLRYATLDKLALHPKAARYVLTKDRRLDRSITLPKTCKHQTNYNQLLL